MWWWKCVEWWFGSENAGGRSSHVLAIAADDAASSTVKKLGSHFGIRRNIMKHYAELLLPSINTLSERIPTPARPVYYFRQFCQLPLFLRAATIYTDLIWGTTPPPRRRREAPPNTAVRIVLTKYAANPTISRRRHVGRIPNQRNAAAV